ncbi:hypothetical protein ACA910_019888 [Epithemia clementina (nom. ined.)]
MQLHLQRALEEMESRQQVQNCLADMVTNVEWAAQCNQEVEVKQTKLALEQVLTQQAAVYQETALIQYRTEKERNKLADALVRELYQVSQSLGELYQLRQDHQELSNNYDSLVAQLLQAEERIQFMQEGGDGGGGATTTTNTNAEPASNQHPQTQVEQSTTTTPAPVVAESSYAQEGAIQLEGPAPSSSGAPVTLEYSDTPGAALTETEAAKAVRSDDVTSTGGGALNNLAVEGESDVPAPSEDAMTVPMAHAPTKTTPVGSNLAAPAEQTEATTTAPPVVSLVEEDEDAAILGQPTRTTSDVVVAIEEDDPPLSLETMDKSALMHIFQYLDALDILNTAQVNIAMYSKVDHLFGLGDGPQGTSEGDNSTIATADSNVAAHYQTPQQSAATTALARQQSGAESVNAAQQLTSYHQSANPDVSMSPTTTSATGESTATGLTTATTTGPPSLPMTPKHGSASNNNSNFLAAPPGQGQGAERSLFGFLQPRKSPVSSSSAASTSVAPAPASGNSTGSLSRKGSSGRSHQQQQEQSPMNAAMANSMASKLSDAELNAIIHMTERLRTKEAQLEQMRADRERLLAQLDGTDAVKQFLVAKVRSMEESLRKTEDQQAKVAQQIASDQEVIAFLDGRVQELEESLSASQAETVKLQAEWKTYQTQAEQKATVLTDMLRFERERVQETQSEFKTTKKLLVKEVKSCRAQIMALSAQNQAVVQENETLKRALLSSGTSSSSTSSPRYRQHVRITSMS